MLCIDLVGPNVRNVRKKAFLQAKIAKRKIKLRFYGGKPLFLAFGRSLRNSLFKSLKKRSNFLFFTEISKIISKIDFRSLSLQMPLSF